MNIERYLNDHRQGTPRQILRLLRQGRVTVNDAPIDSPLATVAKADQVRVDGMTVTGRQPQYLLFNKPIGFQLSMDPTSAHSLGSLLNALDQVRPLKALADLPKEATGLVIASDDDHFLADVEAQEWVSTLRCQLSGSVTQLPSLESDLTFEWVHVVPDDVHQLTHVTVRTRDLTAALTILLDLKHLNGPVSRVAYGPLQLPVDLSVASYRGLFPIEIDDLNGPLDTDLEPHD
ncbi:16S rRNA pseudouridylate synthase [Levilactobacillus brevis]|uniref:16S rRNA pseudouridylate synthase n=1 Tax=Levilactobacillus hammesii TaxID=267633 RepID=A0A921EY91_9LACO|nr:16S rRNA pseudouridylate synthase [Levilactobacillus brevis]HJE85951.1 16S rRNA pseudouridylate synthase [Levilactobacillus hammesii]